MGKDPTYPLTVKELISRLSIYAPDEVVIPETEACQSFPCGYIRLNGTPLDGKWLCVIDKDVYEDMIKEQVK